MYKFQLIMILIIDLDWNNKGVDEVKILLSLQERGGKTGLQGLYFSSVIENESQFHLE